MLHLVKIKLYSKNTEKASQLTLFKLIVRTADGFLGKAEKRSF